MLKAKVEQEAAVESWKIDSEIVDLEKRQKYLHNKTMALRLLFALALSAGSCDKLPLHFGKQFSINVMNQHCRLQQY